MECYHLYTVISDRCSFLSKLVFQEGDNKGSGSLLGRGDGKNLSNGGGVHLSVNKAGYVGIGISVSEKDWTLYESQDTLFCPANTSLTLGATAGGIYSSAILIDMIEIRKLKSLK